MEPMTHLRVKEIAVCKNLMLLACLLGVELLVIFVILANSFNQILT
jgi:hypothetical protein